MSSFLNVFKKPKRLILIVLLISAVATVPWFILMRNYVSGHMIKTEAAVIYIAPYRSRFEPIYKYKDTTGKEYTEQAQEGYTSLYPFNPLDDIYGLKVKVGDKLTLYYDKTNPASTFVMYGWQKGLWLLPLYLAFHLIVIFFAVWLLFVVGKKLSSAS